MIKIKDFISLKTIWGRVHLPPPPVPNTPPAHARPEMTNRQSARIEKNNSEFESR